MNPRLRLKELLTTAYDRGLRFANSRVHNIPLTDILLVSLVAIYAILFSYVSIVRYYEFYAHAWDLGNYNQAMYNTLFNHKLLHYTADLPANPSGTIFGVHFAVILLLLLPVYALLPRPESLLIIQSIFLGAGAAPVYKLTQRRLGSNLVSIAFAGLYLLNPAIQGINWVDFHPEAFIPLFSLLSIYFMDSRRWKLYTLAILLTLSTMEPAAFLVLLTAAYYGWRNRESILIAVRSRHFNRLELRVFSGTILLSVIWLIIALSVIRLYTPHELTLFGGIYTWQTLGAKSLLSVPIVALLNPVGAVNALVNNIGPKILYLLAILGSLGFVPLAALSIAGVGFAWLGIGLLSDNPVYYSLGTQYPAFTIPYVISAFVMGSQKLSRRALQTLILYSTISSAFLSPLTLGAIVSYPYSGPYGIPSIGQHNTNVIALAGMIPPDASVLTQDNLFPFVSSRVDSYVVPTRAFFPVGSSFDQQLSLYVNRVDYVLLDPVFDYIPSYFTFPLLRPSGFGLLASSDGAYLFQKNYLGPVQNLAAYTRIYNYTNLSLLCCRTGNDQTSISKTTFLHEPGYGPISSGFWSGPWVALPAGDYRATFRLKQNMPTEGKLIDIGIVTNRMNVGEAVYGIPGEGAAVGFPAYAEPVPTLYSLSPLYAFNFTSSGVYQSFTFSFQTSDFEFAMFPGFNVSQTASLALDNVVVVQQDIHF